jgi:hypothetical protein
LGKYLLSGDGLLQLPPTANSLLDGSHLHRPDKKPSNRLFSPREALPPRRLLHNGIPTRVIGGRHRFFTSWHCCTATLRAGRCGGKEPLVFVFGVESGSYWTVSAGGIMAIGDMAPVHWCIVSLDTRCTCPRAPDLVAGMVHLAGSLRGEAGSWS